MAQSIHFGTDGWRAVIGDDFTPATLTRTVDAAARVFAEDHPGGTIVIGYDCRTDSGAYAAMAAGVVAAHGLHVKLSDRYCPTPTLCWSVAHDAEATGGVILTSSHNPAEWLGVKLRMEDGGASPKEFTDRVEAVLADEPPTARGDFEYVDLMTPYLDDLASLVDREAIARAHLRVVVDPLYGAGRGYLATLLRTLGVTVDEMHCATDPTFAGLHPEPIIPWVDSCRSRVVELGYDAGFITDGDADRIGGVDPAGNFVNPHRILALVISHLVEDKGQTGRVVRTVSGSNLIERQCERLGLPLVTTPVGFKWIYGEMVKGGVLVGGEESGGIGLPTHVCERDGLLMALILTEMMAQRQQRLDGLLDDMFAKIGRLEYARRDFKITPVQKDAFLTVVKEYSTRQLIGREVVEISRRDGIKFTIADGSWLLLRPSGTEPLVRVYAEAEDMDTVERILDEGCAIATGARPSD